MIGQWSENMQIPKPNGKLGPAALTNNKQENFDQIHADNMIQYNKVRISAKI